MIAAVGLGEWLGMVKRGRRARATGRVGERLAYKACWGFLSVSYKIKDKFC